MPYADVLLGLEQIHGLWKTIPSAQLQESQQHEISFGLCVRRTSSGRQKVYSGLHVGHSSRKFGAN